jgi:CDP-glucose 4,6-dehydratase
MPTDFWYGKRVLLTGHTGFKGAWLALWLQRLGAEVVGIALPPSTQPSLFALLSTRPWIDDRCCDIRNASELKRLVQEARADIVFHLAAQALVRPSYQNPLETFSTNVMGTANLLEAVRATDSVRVVVAVTTDKVYQNREWHYPYREEDALGGHDPYSASKAAAEMVIASYRASFMQANGIALASARAGNVIGGGDWSADRLIPDAVRAWQANQPLVIRNPHATRPWQHVLEPLAAYMTLAEQLWAKPALAGAYNFGPAPDQHASVAKVIELASSPTDYCLVSYEDNSNQPHEANFLALETAKARMELGVYPRWTLAESVTRTMVWYRALNDGAPARVLCESDIARFDEQQVDQSKGNLL